MKILVVGGSGLLGSNILNNFQQKDYRLYYTTHKNTITFPGISIGVDLLDAFEKIQEHDYDVVVNAVALTDVDLCEKQPELAYRLNAEIPERLARFCEREDYYLIHVSTDQIFDGEDKEYTEASTPNPINVYGKTKLSGEKKIQGIMERGHFTILRTNFFGINCLDKLSFSEWILDCLRNKKEIKMFYDVYFNPLLVNTLVEIIDKFIQEKIYGVYNCTSDERISKYEFGQLVKRIFTIDHTIVKTSVKDIKFIARRPKFMYLSNKKLKTTLGIDSLGIDKEILKLYDLYQQNYDHKLKKFYAKN